jgi:hypothetical protein
LGNKRQGGVRRDVFKWNVRQGRLLGFGIPKNGSPINGLVKVESETFEANVVNFGRGSGKLGDSENGIPNARSGCNIGVQDFSKNHAVGEAHVFGKDSMVGASFEVASGLMHGMGIRCRERLSWT